MIVPVPVKLTVPTEFCRREKPALVPATEMTPSFVTSPASKRVPLRRLRAFPVPRSRLPSLSASLVIDTVEPASVIVTASPDPGMASQLQLGALLQSPEPPFQRHAAVQAVCGAVRAAAVRASAEVEARRRLERKSLSIAESYRWRVFPADRRGRTIGRILVRYKWTDF